LHDFQKQLKEKQLQEFENLEELKQALSLKDKKLVIAEE